MFILTLLLMIGITGIISLYTAFGTLYADKRLLLESERMMKWAQEHEDEWLQNTDIIVKEHGMLYYYPKDNSIKHGVIVHYGLNADKTEYGLNYKGNTVFGYKDFLITKSTSHRMLSVNNERVFSIGYQNVITKYGVSKMEVYKKINKEEYYTHHVNNCFTKITKDSDGRYRE